MDYKERQELVTGTSEQDCMSRELGPKPSDLQGARQSIINPGNMGMIHWGLHMAS